MARPLPTAENQPDRRTVSIPMKVTVAADTYRTQNPAEAIRDFSDISGRALTEYLEKRSPGLIERTAADLRNAEQLLAVAESQAAYEVAKTQPSALTRLRKARGRGGRKKTKRG